MREKPGCKVGKILAEISRGLITYSRYRVWIVTDFISWPFWVIFLFLSFTFYAPELLESKEMVTLLAWGFFAFNLVSAFSWSSTAIVTSAQQGIIENLIVSGTSLRIHLVGRFVMSMIDMAVGGFMILFLASTFFGANIYIADPVYFILSMLVATFFFYSFAGVLASLLISMRSPWIIINIIQFILPFTSGGIPVQIFPKQVTNIITLSPFFYIIHPIIASATGFYFVRKELLLTLGILIAFFMYIISNYVEKALIRRTLIKGKITLF